MSHRGGCARSHGRLLALRLCLGLAGVPLAASPQSSSPLRVYTVNYPLQYFAGRIAGEHAVVVFPGPADQDPAFWTPGPATIGKYQRADLILLNGAGYAKWLHRTSLPRRRLVNTSAAFREAYITAVEGITHSHGPGGDHSHAGTAFTTWLDFRQAARQATAIRDAFVRARPGQREAFEHNHAALERELLALDREVEAVAAGHGVQPLLASHPVYQYLARRYGLNLRPVLWEPQVAPSEGQWQALAALLVTHPARWMLWEGEPHPASVQRLKRMGVGSLVVDPCANAPAAGEDFLTVMRRNVGNLKRAFE
jgi:zinc transport system substrate-binding protein